MATSTTARTKRLSVSSSAPTGSGPRLDVQGLRAVAVLAVIVNHLFAWPRGGFVGVDVFFVLSGFLITGLLIKERASTGGISFAAFYRRRFRRIVPAATATIVVTVVGAYALISGARGRDVLGDGLWAMFFGANWHFASIGTDYFHNDSVSPLQHFWSLAVEEQFYVAWPLVILVTWRLARGHRRTWAVLVAAMGSLCGLSFAYSMWHTSEQPTWAYFSTFDRAWELGRVSLLAKPDEDGA